MHSGCMLPASVDAARWVEYTTPPLGPYTLGPLPSWDHSPQDHTLWKEHGTRQEVTSHPPLTE